MPLYRHPRVPRLQRIIPARAEPFCQFVTVSELIDITGNTNAVFTTKR
ncbi:MAG: hypothetical protein Q4B19_02180 [Clostridia bacterium]|nr:hypothetical protein [Clostridia bacterium]